MHPDPDPHGWRCEGRDLLRAVAGGSIVGMPLLFTMEMWEHGAMRSEFHLLGLLGAVLALNFLFSLLSGFREEYSVGEAISEAITGVGIALVLSAAILALLGELTATLSTREMLGKVLLAATAVSIGIAFANAQVLGRSRTGEEQEVKIGPLDRQLRADLKEGVAALAGSTVFALNVAPTEEIALVAARLSPWQLLALLIASIALCYVILFAAEFREHAVHVQSFFQTKPAEVLLTCGISLLVSAGLLLFHGYGSPFDQWPTAIASIVVLGLPATVGGAAGRLIV